MAVTFLTTEDAQAILNEMREVRMLINEVGKDVGDMIQMRHDLEQMMSIASTLNKTLVTETKYHRSKEYRDSIIKEYTDSLIKQKK